MCREAPSCATSHARNQHIECLARVRGRKRLWRRRSGGPGNLSSSSSSSSSRVRGGVHLPARGRHRWWGWAGLAAGRAPNGRGPGSTRERTGGLLSGAFGEATRKLGSVRLLASPWRSRCKILLSFEMQDCQETSPWRWIWHLGDARSS